MKKLLLIVAMCGIFFGCSSSLMSPVAKSEVLIPRFTEETHMIQVVGQDEYSCDNGQTSEGVRIAFITVELATGNQRFFASWVTHDELMFLMEYIQKSPNTPPTAARIWIDVNKDLVADEYFEDPTKMPGFPNLCVHTATLRKSRG